MNSIQFYKQIISDLNISDTTKELLKYGASAIVIYKISTLLFSKEKSITVETNSTSELLEEMKELKSSQDWHGNDHANHLQTIIELQQKYLKNQQLEIINKRKEEKRVDEELIQLR